MLRQLTKYMALPRDKIGGQNHNIQINNKSFERVKQFKYLGTALWNENSFQEEIKRRLK
jgi:hypothetical protein